MIKKSVIFLFLLSLAVFGFSPRSWADTKVNVSLNGNPLPLTPEPLIREGRTLIPIRPMFEAINATVTWEGPTQTVTATRGDKYVRFNIDERFACLDVNCTKGALMDVPAQLINHKTFVPLRFVSTALGAGASWDAQNNTARIEDPAVSPPEALIQILNVPQTINGAVNLQTSVSGITSSLIRFYLLDKKTVKGPVIAVGTDPNGSYAWKPDPGLKGDWYLAAIAYDQNKKPFYSELQSITIAPDMAVDLQGVIPDQTVTQEIKISVQHHFTASHVEYKLVDPASPDAAVTLGLADPEKDFSFIPQVEQNGKKQLFAVIYDRTGASYTTSPVPINIQATPAVSQTGLSENQTIDPSVSIKLKSNFYIDHIELRSGDVMLYQAGHSDAANLPQMSAQQFATITWVPALSHNGSYSVSLLVYDRAGKTYEVVSALPLTVAVKPTLRLNVGPDQIITEPIELKASANLMLRDYDLVVENLETGQKVVLTEGQAAGTSFTWTPLSNINRKYEIQATARDQQGSVLQTEKRTIKVVTTKTYGATPLVAKDQFRSLIEPFALKTMNETNMAASIQMAQAILESGWGQYVPTDKYTGQVSNNLFGIKGKGSNGSVTSSTSENYNGLYYRIEALFRAYKDVSESWQDHADLLLTRSWYAPFRATMHDPVQGAWGLYTSGYATAPDYAVKLINLMRQQKLFEVDWVMP